MAVRRICRYGEDILRRRTKPVPYAEVAQILPALLQDMWDTCAACNGAGLAANQIGLPLRLAVIMITEGKDKVRRFVLLNPKIIDKAGEMEEDEGCLSFPGFFAPTVRYSQVKVRAQDESGREYELIGRGLLAKALQHEIDHLDGKLFIDRIPQVEKSRAKAHLREVSRTWEKSPREGRACGKDK